MRWSFMNMAYGQAEVRSLVQLLDLYRQWMAASVDRSLDEVNQGDPAVTLVEFDAAALDEWRIALDLTVDRLIIAASTEAPQSAPEVAVAPPPRRRAGLRLVE